MTTRCADSTASLSLPDRTRRLKPFRALLARLAAMLARGACLDAANLELVLRPDRPVRLDGLRGRALHCVEGRVWITLPGHGEDIFLAAGERWRIPRDNGVLIEGVGRATVRLEL